MAQPSWPGIDTRTLRGPGVEDDSNLSLLVISGDYARRIPLAAGTVAIIGRAAEADITVPDAAVSRLHARFSERDGDVWVADEGSHNGTEVNGARIDAERSVADGDVVRVGATSVIVRGGRARGSAIDAGALAGRLAAEIDRALAFDRALGVVAVAADARDDDVLTVAVRQTLGPGDVAARVAPGTWIAVLPERDREEAVDIAERLAAEVPGARRAAMTCPADAVDAADAIAQLVGAVSASAPGREPRTRAVVAGDREILVAEPAMQRIFELLRRLAASEATVLVVGETGVGKEHAAHAVHAWSARAAAPFVAVNCAALADGVIDSELFGHVRGAFTGAAADRVGYFEAASGGTLFLDEVGELSPAGQAKLLRALEARAVTRVGETRERAVDVRVVAATNRDLEREVAAGSFREDLYYRLATAVVEVPPLRERRREIPALARAFAPDGPGLSESALRALVAHRWPGNVRELKAAITYAVAMAAGGPIEAWHLPDGVRDPQADVAAEPEPPPTGFRPLAEEIAALEKRRMQEALAAAGGVRTRAAALLGVPRRTFTLKMRAYGLRG